MVEIVAIVKFINSFFIPMWIPLLFFQVSDFFPPPLWGQDRDSEKALLLLLLLFFLRISRSLNKETLPFACRIPSGQKLESFRWYALRYFLIGEGKAHLLISKEKREKSVCRFRRRRSFVGGHFLNVWGRQMVKRDFWKTLTPRKRIAIFDGNALKSCFKKGKVCLWNVIFFAG